MTFNNTKWDFMTVDETIGLKCDFCCKSLGIESQKKWHDKQFCSVTCEQKYRSCNPRKSQVTSRLIPDETFEIHKK
ncbi:MAG: hypothetical protein SVY15_08005 [Halobacteriota archaeon]|nr:hypothetical protein [Halobacteriota archaeon]